MKSKSMKITRTGMLLTGLGVASAAFGIYANRTVASSFITTGMITPSAMKITVTGASLIRADNSEVQVLSGTHELEFTRSGAPFTAIPMAGISVPMGRYIGVRINFDDRYSVKLSGDKYVGTGLASGTPLYTPVAVDDSSAANSFSTSVSTTTAFVKLPNVSQCTDCSAATYFARPACVAGSEASCKAGDQYVGGDGTKLPDLNVVVDMYQSIQIDANSKAISRGAVYPFAVIGRPGAAIHLTSGGVSSGGTRNASILIGSDKKIQSVATWGGGNTNPGPRGGSWVTATAGPAVNAYGPTMFAELDVSGTGVVKFPMGDCPGTSCTSSGLATLTGVLQPAGSTVAFTCTDDTNGSLGYTYAGGSCGASGVTQGNMKIARIVDPSNLFGICTVAGGICSATNAEIDGASTDGYL